MSEKAVNEHKETWWLYIIQNKLGHLYTGITTDVDRRFQQHNSGSAQGAKALRGKGPLTLKYKRLIGSKSEAARVEYWVKQQTRQRKLQIISRNEALSGSLISQNTNNDEC